MRTMSFANPMLASWPAGPAVRDRLIGVGVDDRQRFALERDRHRQGDGRGASERRAAAVGELAAHQLLEAAGARGARDERVHVQGQDELGHVRRLVEADLVLALESVGLHPEERDA